MLHDYTIQEPLAKSRKKDVVGLRFQAVSLTKGNAVMDLVVTILRTWQDPLEHARGVFWLTFSQIILFLLFLSTMFVLILMWSNIHFSSDCTNGLSDEQCLHYAKMYCPQSCNQCNESDDCIDVQTSSWCGQLKKRCQCTCSGEDGPYTTVRPGNLKSPNFVQILS